eukprot:m.33589 g.33589  ORF g.33589 m.33589 type:complete len:796 (+) comp14244_c0_seq2:392-2779(+)
MLNVRRHFERQRHYALDGKICDDSEAAQRVPQASLDGLGHTRDVCALACYNQSQCVYFNYAADTGACTMFSRCDRTVAAAEPPAVTYVRSAAVMGDLFSMIGTPSTTRCDVSSQQALIGRLEGDNRVFVDCLAACYTQQSCNFFVFSDGTCELFQSCDDSVPSTNSETYVRNTKASVHDQLHDVWEDFRLVEDDIGQICDNSVHRQRSSRNRLSGSGHSLKRCSKVCRAQKDCVYFTLSDKGHCAMFSSCEHKRASDAHRLFVRKEISAFQHHATGMRCVGDHNKAPLNAPDVTTASECAKVCDDLQDRCNYFHMQADGAMCELFVACDAMEPDPSFTVYERKHRLQLDGVSHYHALTTTTTDVPRTEALLLFKIRECPGEEPCGTMVTEDWKYMHAGQTGYDKFESSGLYGHADSGFDNQAYEQPITCADPPANIPRCTDEGEVCVFNLRQDPCEYNDTASTQPELKYMFQNRLADYWMTKKQPNIKVLGPENLQKICTTATLAEPDVEGMFGLWEEGPETGGACADYVDRSVCSVRRNLGQCDTTHESHRYMMLNCRQTCGFCAKPGAVSPVPSCPSHAVRCGKTGRCSDPSGDAFDSDLHKVRCCSDTHLAGWKMNPGCSSWHENDRSECMTGTFPEAASRCAASGGRLCTAAEVAANCVSGSGCKFDRELIWTSTTGTRTGCYRHLVRCGKPGLCAQLSTHALDNETHHVRCCSDVRIAGWKRNGECSVWHTSDRAGLGECLTGTYMEAVSYCAAGGGRLCTASEVETDCVSGSGCRFDRKLVWTSSSIVT